VLESSNTIKGPFIMEILSKVLVPAAVKPNGTQERVAGPKPISVLSERGKIHPSNKL